MADDIVLSAAVGTGATVAADEIASKYYPRSKLIHGADGVNAGDVSLANGFPVQPATSTTWAVTQSGSWTVTGAGGTFPVTDSGSSLTVDAPVGTPVFVRLSDGSAAIATLPVSVASIPSHAVTNAGTFAVQAELETRSARAGGVAVTPKRAIIDAATSGDNTLVAAVASKKILVTGMLLVASGTTTVRLESGAGGTALSGQMNLTAQTGFTLPFNPHGWFETAANTLLNLELSAAVSVDGVLTYLEVD